MKPIEKKIILDVANYYSNKLAEHGENFRGVDWNSEDGQNLRFQQLCEIIKTDQTFSINDLGCGYGALYDYMNENFNSFSYLGIDVSNDMIKAGQARFKSQRNVKFIMSNEPDKIADFTVASGIFNVRLDKSDVDWFHYIQSVLDILDKGSRKGFAFNCLTAYSDQEKKRDYLYYADPCAFFSLCKHRYSDNVALLHDYGLYEFTILVRKQL
jgi:SAM-dependent methyltransferase